MIRKGKETMHTDATSSSISGPGTKKGFVLAITLMMLVMISVAATMLWYSSNTSVQIAANVRRAALARHSAMSGINHFMSMNFYADDVYEMLGGASESQIINKTRLPGTKQLYDVKVSVCCDQNGDPLREGLFKIISTGYYGNNSGTHAVHVLEATIKTTDE